MTPSTYKLIYPQKGEWFTVTLVHGKYVGMWHDWQINAKFEYGYIENGVAYLRFTEQSPAYKNLFFEYNIKLEDIESMKREFVERKGCSYITGD